MNSSQRASILASHCKDYTEYLGHFSSSDLIQWLEHELGHAEALDAFFPVANGGIRTKAVATPIILHILSGNTPHAGLQSLLRGLLVGSKNIIKLPSSGLSEVTSFIDSLPSELSPLVEITNDLSDATFISASTVIAIGSDETMGAIQARIQPHQRFIPHGHKLSIGLIESATEKAARLATKDICAYNQQGCLSLHAIYVKDDPRAFAEMLAQAMAEYEQTDPRGDISISESGAISNQREIIRYQAANDPENHALWHSKCNTAWTVIYKNDPTLTPSPLNRVVYVQPAPENWDELGREKNYLSTLSIHPKESLLAEVEALDFVPRICSLGESQHPSLFWHHDGFPPLASLVTWRDIH